MERIELKVITALIMLGILLMPLSSEAGALFHATKKVAAKRIMQRGFSAKMMKPNARFGKGVYASESKSLALKEKPTSDSVVVLKDTKMLQQYKINTSSLTKDKLKKLSGDLDLRGNVRKGIIGPDLGRKIGKTAAKSGNVVVYPSVKGKGNNYFIPQSVYQEHPKIIRPSKVISEGR
jgi:hypothetical protein